MQLRPAASLSPSAESTSQRKQLEAEIAELQATLAIRADRVAELQTETATLQKQVAAQTDATSNNIQTSRRQTMDLLCLQINTKISTN